jgi:hypothetical protein
MLTVWRLLDELEGLMKLIIDEELKKKKDGIMNNIYD